MKRCLAIRWGAFGDMLYALPALERLKKEYPYLHLETGSRGKLLFDANPIFDKISSFDLVGYDKASHHMVAQLRWKTLEDVGWDKAVNFWRCLEASCILEEWQEGFFHPRERRRKEMGHKNFYDMHLEKCGFPTGLEDCGTFYFPEEVLFWTEFWKKQHHGKFNIVIALAGSTAQKTPFGMRELAEEISNAWPDARFYLVGDREGAHLQFSLGKSNVVQTCGTWPYLQAMALTRMADYVIGPETSLLVAAGMFGTPKTMIATSCGYEQATKYQKNDFSIQSTFACSPCYRAIYNYGLKASQRYCNEVETQFGKIPGCNLHWDKERILKGVEFAYKMRGVRRELERSQKGPGFTTLPDLQPPLLPEGDRNGEVRPSVLPEVRTVRKDTAWLHDIDATLGPGVEVPAAAGAGS